MMAEQIPRQTEPNVNNIIHESDRMWRTLKPHNVLSQNQSGSIIGHYLQIDGPAVRADAVESNDKAEIKVHLVVDGPPLYNRIVMLESVKKPGWVVAIDKANEKIIAMKAPKELMAYNTLTDVSQQNPEMLFYQKPKSSGSSISYFQSYLNDKVRLLGFDTSGKPMDPTKVDPVRVEAHFRIISDSSY